MGRRLGLVAAAVLVLGVSVPPGAAAAPDSVTVGASWFGVTPPLTPGQIEVAVVSSLPSTVTGGDARMEVRGLQPGDNLKVDRDGTDVTASLAPAGTGVVDGVVSGLHVGANHVTATATGPAGTRRATLEVTDHRITGPVISGPHQDPIISQTEAADMGNPLYDDRSADPRVDEYARLLNGRTN